MELYILRHAIAEPKDATNAREDSQRELTPEGKRKMRRMAKGMKALNLAFDLVLSSPFLRARQTAEIVVETFKFKPGVELLPALAAGEDARDLISQLNKKQAARKSLLLVGHEPDLSRLIGLLLAGDPTLSIVLKKGGLCKLSAAALKFDRCATLEWLLTPRQLERLR